MLWYISTGKNTPENVAQSLSVVIHFHEQIFMDVDTWKCTTIVFYYDTFPDTYLQHLNILELLYDNITLCYNLLCETTLVAERLI